MQKELYKVEAAISAQSSGNLTWGSWTHDAITALGLSGVRNPIGFAVVRYLSESRPTSIDVWALVLALSGNLIKRGKDATKTSDIAAKAIMFWRDMRCSTCQGRGVTDFQQTPCKVCHGTGKRYYGSLSNDVKEAVEMLAEAEAMMEKQLRAKLNGMTYVEPDGKKVNIAIVDYKDGFGMNINPVTPRAPACP